MIWIAEHHWVVAENTVSQQHMALEIFAKAFTNTEVAANDEETLEQLDELFDSYLRQEFSEQQSIDDVFFSDWRNKPTRALGLDCSVRQFTRKNEQKGFYQSCSRRETHCDSTDEGKLIASCLKNLKGIQDTLSLALQQKDINAIRIILDSLLTLIHIEQYRQQLKAGYKHVLGICTTLAHILIQWHPPGPAPATISKEILDICGSIYRILGDLFRFNLHAFLDLYCAQNGKKLDLDDQLVLLLLLAKSKHEEVFGCVLGLYEFTVSITKEETRVAVSQSMRRSDIDKVIISQVLHFYRTSDIFRQNITVIVDYLSLVLLPHSQHYADVLVSSTEVLPFIKLCFSLKEISNAIQQMCIKLVESLMSNGSQQTKHQVRQELLAELEGRRTSATDEAILEEQAKPLCQNCKGRFDALKKCSACHQVSYCSRECQVQHWTHGHKDECAKLKAQGPHQK